VHHSLNQTAKRETKCRRKEIKERRQREVKGVMQGHQLLRTTMGAEPELDAG